MKIWIVAYEQPGEREILVEAYYSNREAVDRANQIDEELEEQEDTCTATSITEIEIETDGDKQMMTPQEQIEKTAELNTAQSAALEAIDNFILHFTSNDAERERMAAAAVEYVEQDHALREPQEGVKALTDGDYLLTEGGAWVELNGLAIRIRKDSEDPENAVSVTVCESGNEQHEIEHLVFERPETPAVTSMPEAAEHHATTDHAPAAVDGDSIDITWNIEDVKSVRPDLTDEQAREVLRFAKRHHDSNVGISWEVLESVAISLFGKQGDAP